MPMPVNAARIPILTSAALAVALWSCQAIGGEGTQTAAAEPQPDRVVKQEPGKVVYWVPPGPRKLSQKVFGTPDNPRMTLEPKLRQAEQMVEAGKAPPSVPQLLKDLPILVAVPMKARTMENGEWWLKHPTPFPDKGMIVEGHFTARYWDRVSEDPPGPPGKTPDKADMEAEFTDPAGNRYRVVLDHVVKPPFPGYATQGGVLLNGYHHGVTGTGTPLMLQVFTIAAFWGVGDVYINGKLAQPHRVMHMMTTEVVRDKDYHLALEKEMPLHPDEWHVKGQAHHTHLIVLPITPVKGKGPVFKPLKTAYELPNGKTQPFMHIMFEQDTVMR